MKTNKTVTYCGSITKKESLIPLESHILENTWVAEANFPYANYYGQVPAKPKPNSLFLFVYDKKRNALTQQVITKHLNSMQPSNL